ncbi:MAG TPA: HNH endonuclease [Thermoanaerobaculia bacterium]|nr:HNH endonuclease [Thermoanaerobaculia bacterium]
MHNGSVLDETRLRLDAIQFVRALRERWVAVPASELRRFRIHLKGQSGIFKPADLSVPLSITTTIDSDKAQDTIEGSRVLYDYVSRDFDNDSLKRCAEDELPLIYFLQVKRRPATEYLIFAPVYVVGWSDESRCFLIDLSELKPGEVVSPAPVRRQLQLPVLRGEIRELTKSFAITTVQRRLYEARFRNAVLEAYRERCAVCGLHVRTLLDAAHVDGDGQPKTDIDVREGIALCATHRRAFDAGMLRYDDDYVVRVESADPMLLEFEGRALILPSEETLRPNPLS